MEVQLPSGAFWQDKTIRLWDTVTGKHKQTLEGHRRWVLEVMYSPDGGTLASASGDGTIRLWDATTGEHKHTLEGHTDEVYSIAYAPDGNLLVSGSFREIHLWDVATGRYA